MTGALIVFAKPPTPGNVKTRLVSELSARDAAALYRAFLDDALEQYAALSFDVRLYMAEPEDGDAGLDVLGSHHFEQEGSGLGERMHRAFAGTFGEGYDRAVIVGTDHPTLPTAFIEQAFDLLTAPQSIVIGPADDGGYYLLGMNDPRPEVFREMTYSHDRVFDETLDRALASGAFVSILPQWYDVDTPADLRRLAAELSDGGAGVAPRTRRLLGKLAEHYAVLQRL
jgi:hypothetical protein